MRRTFFLLAALACLPPAGCSAQCTSTSANFQAEAPTPLLAEALCRDAERHRLRFLREFLGKPHPSDWPVRVPIVAAGDIPAGEAEGGWCLRLGVTHRWIQLRYRDPAYPLTVLGHEVVHATLYGELGGDMGRRWLTEGLALYYETLDEGYPGRFRDRCGLLPLRAFFATVDIPPGVDGHDYYGQSYAVVRFLCDRYGRDNLMPFYKMGCAISWEAAAWSVYKVKLEDLDQAWRDHLRTWESPYPRSLRGTRP